MIDNFDFIMGSLYYLFKRINFQLIHWVTFRLTYTNASGINKKWVTDITYIHTLKDGWCYLTSVMDLFTKKIVGYSFFKKIDTKITLEALNRDYNSQKPNNKVIIHSDRGTQYISDIFRKKLKI